MPIASLLAAAIKHGASDIHLSVGHPPVLRIDGQLIPLKDRALTASTVESYGKELAGPVRWPVFRERLEADFGYENESRRFRVNLHVDRGETAVAMRVVRKDVPTFEEIGLPDAARRFAEFRNGIVLVTGSSGMGKSTTLAAMVGTINAERAVHILTLEDPIEFVFPNEKGLMKQREVGSDTHTFAEGLRHALRQDPDVIMVGEMRDPETISSALTLAETGHLVFSTLHTNSAAEAVHRIVDSFPEHQQDQVRAQLALTLRGVVAQVLLPKKEGSGRVAAHEILLNVPAVANLIRENKVEQIATVIQTGRSEGMVPMARAVEDLRKAGEISDETAMPFSPRARR